jgi:hypothetical protein
MDRSVRLKLNLEQSPFRANKALLAVLLIDPEVCPIREENLHKPGNFSTILPKPSLNQLLPEPELYIPPEAQGHNKSDDANA